MRSLVTGAAGFIGSHVARHCLQMGHEVVALDDLSGGFQDQIPPGARFVLGSVTDRRLVTDLFEEFQFDYVYHLAAYAAEGLSHFIRRFNYENNLLGSVNLINESVRQDVRCFVFASSIAVYGSGQVPMDEEMTPKPEDPYGVSKYAVELDLQCAQHLFGLRHIVFRPHNVYGPHQNIGDRYRNVIGIFMNQVMQDLPMTIFGDGTQTRAFSYIDDIAPCIARSVDTPAAWNQVFNIGADTPYSVAELAKVVAAAFGRNPEIEYLPARKEVLHAYSSHEKAARLLNYRARVDLVEGVSRMASWARLAGARQGEPFQDIELGKNLPPSWKNTASRAVAVSHRHA